MSHPTPSRILRASRSLRALLRIEARQIQRQPGRAILVALLVAVPVAAVMGGATLARITEPSREERSARVLGAADLRIDFKDAADLGVLREILPAAARVERVYIGTERVEIPGRQFQASVFALSPDALGATGLAVGMLHLAQGRPPANSGEVALSPVLLAGLGRSVGETVTLAYGPERRITGIVIDPEELNRPLILRTPAAVELPGVRALLVELPKERAGNDGATFQSLRDAGFRIQNRSAAAEEKGGLAALVFALGGIGFAEAALVIAATFAVGLRRRQYEIGLLGSAGAAIPGITASLLLSSGALALVGSLFGLLLGTGGAALIHPYLDGWNGRLNGAFEVSATDSGIALLIGILTALLGAVVPAAKAARIPIRVALGQRRPAASTAGRSLVLGLTLVIAGLALLAFAPHGNRAAAALGVIGGPILGILGFGACSPWILDQLAQRAAKLPLAWRLAVRDAGRFRGRNGPVVTAVLAGMSMSVTVAVLVTSIEAALDAVPADLRHDQLLVEGPGAEELVARMRAELPVVAAARLEAAYVHGEPVRARIFVAAPDSLGAPGPESVATGDEELLRVLCGVAVDAATTEAFRSGYLIAFDPPSGAAAASLRMWLEDDEIIRLPLKVVNSRERVREPRFVLHAGALERLGMYEGPLLRRSLSPWLIQLDTAVTPASLERAQVIAAGSFGTTIDARLLHRAPVRSFYRIMLAISILTGLVVVALATALSAAESRSDETVLRSVGAAPGLLRRHQAARAGYLALLGCALAVPAGMIPAFAIFSSANIPLEFVMVPWHYLFITVLGLPLLTYVGTWVLGGCAQRSRAMTWISVLAALLLGATPAFPGEIAAPIRWEAHVGRAFDGSALEGEIGHFRVRESRARPGGRTIELAFVRYRTSHPHPGPPVFFLAGGPGGSGVDLCGGQATHPQMRLLEHADVIGLDQRGTGRNFPNLTGDPDSTRGLGDDEVFPVNLPLDRPVERETWIRTLEEATARCAAHWTRAGVDLGAYNTEESADDIDDLRIALGLERINLFGASYGSHLALAYLRRHSEHVNRAVLRNVEGPDDTWKLPSTVQRHLERLNREAADDPAVRTAVPDLLASIRQLLDTLERNPVHATAFAGTERETGIVLGPYDLQIELARALGSARTLATIPSAVYRMSTGDWNGLADAACEERQLRVPLLALLMDCASGATLSRRQRIETESRDDANLLGDAILAPLFPSLCRACRHRDLGDDYRLSFGCDVPTLFVSGTLDVRTPPANVEAILPGFTQGSHIVVENAGHDSRELMSQEYRQLLQAFLRGEDVPSCRLTLPRIQFEPVNPGTDSPVTHSSHE